MKEKFLSTWLTLTVWKQRVLMNRLRARWKKGRAILLWLHWWNIDTVFSLVDRLVARGFSPLVCLPSRWREFLKLERCSVLTVALHSKRMEWRCQVKLETFHEFLVFSFFLSIPLVNLLCLVPDISSPCSFAKTRFFVLLFILEVNRGGKVELSYFLPR